jgi:Ca2+-binding RTX toxin-like protein
MTADRHFPRRTACIAGALALSSGLLAAAAPSAVGQAMVVVPPGCGSLSGTLVDASRLEDHSADTVPLGVVGGAAYQVPVNPVGDQITVLTPFSDNVQGAPVGETLCALDGDDEVDGNQGDDDIFGGEGSDTIQGGEATDFISGGPQDDILHGNDALNLNPILDSADEIQGGEGRDLLTGESGDDVLEGGDHRDTLEGGADHDTLNGGDGNDDLRGQDGRDVLGGDRGNDILRGGDDADTLDGGPHTDTLTGGGGSDSRSNGETCLDAIENPFLNVPPAC